MDDLRQKLAVQARQSAENLSHFLENDLELSFTMLRSARTIRDPERIAATLGRVRRALTIIRTLQGRLDDPGERKAIHDRTNDLERELNSFAEPEDREAGESGR
jgi:hypothetical protein